MLLASRLARLRCTPRRQSQRQMGIETLEDRILLSYLLVPDYDKHNVLRYDGTTGAFLDEFVPRKSGGLNQPHGVLFGPHDQNLYLSTGHLFGTGPGRGWLKAVVRYDGSTGEFLDEFVQDRQMDQPHAFIFGPDGNLYIGDRPGGNVRPQGGRILRFDGVSGEYLDEFVPLGSGGLWHPNSVVFGPSGDGDGKLDLYVSDELDSRVMRYDGITGAFLGEFVSEHSGGLAVAAGLTFGPDGNLYIANFGPCSIMRYQGPSGSAPGAAMPSAGNTGATFIPRGTDGFCVAGGLVFGPDGNGDGEQDLYVTYADLTGELKGKNGSVRRYDGITGAFIDTFVSERSGGLDDPYFLTFTETDPVTLAYKGVDRTSVSNADVVITNLPGGTLGEASGDTVWLDVNAAGLGWFVDAAPPKNIDSHLPGYQGEQPISLLTASDYEIDQLLRFAQSEDVMMHDALEVGTRNFASNSAGLFDLVVLWNDQRELRAAVWWENIVRGDDAPQQADLIDELMIHGLWN